VLLRAFLWLKISDLSFHYSPESKGIEICNGIATCHAACAEDSVARCGSHRIRHVWPQLQIVPTEASQRYPLKAFS
jgi:hypothetical protein